jgi:hypothetical protein
LRRHRGISQFPVAGPPWGSRAATHWERLLQLPPKRFPGCACICFPWAAEAAPPWGSAGCKAWSILPPATCNDPGCASAGEVGKMICCGPGRPRQGHDFLDGCCQRRRLRGQPLQRLHCLCGRVTGTSVRTVGSLPLSLALTAKVRAWDTAGGTGPWSAAAAVR